MAKNNAGKRNKYTSILISICILMFMGADAMAKELFVAPGGSDQNSGTKEKPFATLERSREEVRILQRKEGLPKGGVIVWLRGGTYEFNETFELTKEDSGTKDAPIVYRAFEGEEVRLAGGKGIPSSAFKTLTDSTILKRLVPAANGKVLQVDLKAQGITNFGEMKVRGFGHPLVPSALEPRSITE